MSQKKIENFDNQNGLTTEQLIEQAVARAEARIKSQMLKSSTNAIQLGALVVDKEVKQGSEMIDRKSGEPIVDNHSGEVRRYPNKLYVTFSFFGGSLVQEVKPLDYDKLQLNKKYFCTGSLREVSNFGKTDMLPVLNEFEELAV